MGRLINHSLDGNLTVKVIDSHGVPRLCFYAKRDILAGETLDYDYGEDRRPILKALPWLRAKAGLERWRPVPRTPLEQGVATLQDG